ncbi:hypothetical protein AB1K91_01345 [Terribacillus sp. 179-K 1B1 HS]
MVKDLSVPMIPFIVPKIGLLTGLRTIFVGFLANNRFVQLRI